MRSFMNVERCSEHGRRVVQVTYLRSLLPRVYFRLVGNNGNTVVAPAVLLPCKSKSHPSPDLARSSIVLASGRMQELTFDRKSPKRTAGGCSTFAAADAALPKTTAVLQLP